jgi:hypothetical protein
LPANEEIEVLGVLAIRVDRDPLEPRYGAQGHCEGDGDALVKRRIKRDDLVLLPPRDAPLSSPVVDQGSELKLFFGENQEIKRATPRILAEGVSTI